MADHRASFPLAMSRLGNRVRARGIGEVAALVRDRVRETISSDDTLLFYTRPSGGDDPEQEGLVVRPAKHEDAALYARDIGTDSPSSFRARLSDSTHCFLVLRGDAVVHSSWVTTSAAWTREIRSYLVAPAGGAYVYESFTRREVRGRGVYPFALRKIARWAAGVHAATVWVAVEAANPASIRAVEKAGFEEAFRISYRRRWGRLWVGPPTGRMAQIGTNFVRRTA